MQPIRALIVSVVTALGIFTLAPHTFAQNTEWLQLDVVTVVPDRFEDYRELQFDQVNPALQRAGVPWRNVLRTAQFGNSYELRLVRPISDFGEEYDRGDALQRVLEPDDRQRLLDRVRRITVSRNRYALRARPELSIVPENPPLQLIRMTTIQVAPGRVREWEDFIQSSLPMFTNADLEFLIYESVLGPGPTTWLLVENIASFAQAVQPSLVVRAFGDRADAAAEQIADVVTSIERTVLRSDAELSYNTLAVARVADPCSPERLSLKMLFVPGCNLSLTHPAGNQD